MSSNGQSQLMRVRIWKFKTIKLNDNLPIGELMTLLNSPRNYIFFRLPQVWNVWFYFWNLTRIKTRFHHNTFCVGSRNHFWWHIFRTFSHISIHNRCRQGRRGAGQFGSICPRPTNVSWGFSRESSNLNFSARISGQRWTAEHKRKDEMQKAK